MTHKQTETKYLTYRTILFSTLLFALVLVVGGVIFALTMRQIVKENKRNELVRLLDDERVKIETPVRDRVQIVLRMAGSPLIQRYFADPGDRALEKMAFEEIAGYRRVLPNNVIFWVNDADRKFYFGDSFVYTVDPADTMDYWYNMTLYETESFNFNINYNPMLNDMKLWVNAPVFDIADSGRPVGIIGAGIDISEFVSGIYENYRGGAELYFFNSAGEVTGARDITLITTKSVVERVLGETGAEIMARKQSLTPGETQTFSTAAGEVGMCMIPSFGWYAAAVIPNSLDDYKTSMTWLFLAMLLTMALILTVFNVFIAKLVKPLRHTMALEVALKVKGDFLAKMSHEIRTPMNAITGMAELALREEMSPAVRDHVQTIRQAGSNLLSIINDILDLSKIESGKLEITPVDYRFASLINDVVSIIKVRLVGSPVRFVADIDESIPGTLFGDVVRVRQVLLNILSNAVKYTKQGSITFSIRGSKPSDSDGPTTLRRGSRPPRLPASDAAQTPDDAENTVVLTIRVADTGIGIRPEDIDRLFGDFVQVDLTANKWVEGTGLGLSIARSLTEAMGGSISVTSVYGEGSTFTITLPQRVRPGEPFALTLPDRPAEATAATFCAPDARVLVVDDINTNLKVAEGLLAPYGIKIDLASSGEQALDAIKKCRYDMVFMDHMMPGMDGVETVKRIRELGGGVPYFKNVPIVALTANAVSGTKEMFLQNGFSDFLSKPIYIADLNATLDRWIPDDKKIEAEAVAASDSDAKAGIDIAVDGLDVKLGIGRTGGMVAGYLSTLGVFCDDGRRKIDEIRAALEAGDIPLYTTYVHALKSASANVGAMGLSEAARELETAGKRGDTAFISEHSDNLLAFMASFLGKVDGSLSAIKRDSGQPPGIDAGTLKSVLANLKSAIDDLNPGAINAAAKQLEQFENACDTDAGGKIKIVRQRVLTGEYDEAVELIDALSQRPARGA